MKIHAFLRRRMKWLKAMRPADICLLLFMVILMAQLTCNLFLREMGGEDIASIDVVIRTTAAAIFGYFIGGGFLNRRVNRDTDSVSSGKNASQGMEGTENGELRAQSGFGSQGKEDVVRGNTEKQNDRNDNAYFSRLQIIIVAGIGMYSLFLLILVRDMGEASSSAAATVSQLRDFLSGSVGLLIGHSAQSR